MLRKGEKSHFFTKNDAYILLRCFIFYDFFASIFGVSFFLLIGISTLHALTLKEVAENRKWWPTRVALTQDVELQVLQAGGDTQSVLGKKGEEFRVKNIEEKLIDLRVRGGVAILYAEDTDLLKRVEYLQKYGEEKAEPQQLQGGRKPETPMEKRLSSHLVKEEKGALKPAPRGALNGVKYYIIYHSAHWCPPCRAFTPKLVQFYNRQIEKNPQAELIFISADRDANGMQQYMSGANMPWPAIAFHSRSEFQNLRAPLGRGIPALALFNAQGEVLISNQGASRTLQEIDKFLQSHSP